MSDDTVTYRCDVQLGASIKRREDAIKLQEHGRYMGAAYLGGYAIECSMKAAICDYEQKSNFKETRLYQKTTKHSDLHILSNLLGNLPTLQRHINNDRTGTYRRAWSKIITIWRHDNLRYSDDSGDENECREFISAVCTIHTLIVDTIIQPNRRRRR